MASKDIRGRELNGGDTIRTWFGQQPILSLRPYVGTLYPNDGARIATFGTGREMTIDDSAIFELVVA